MLWILMRQNQTHWDKFPTGQNSSEDNGVIPKMNLVPLSVGRTFCLFIVKQVYLLMATVFLTVICAIFVRTLIIFFTVVDKSILFLVLKYRENPNFMEVNINDRLNNMLQCRSLCDCLLASAHPFWSLCFSCIWSTNRINRKLRSDL